MKLEITLLNDGRIIVAPAEGYSLTDRAMSRIRAAVDEWMKSDSKVGVILDSAVVHDLRIPPMAAQLDRIEAKLDQLLDQEPGS